MQPSIVTTQRISHDKQSGIVTFDEFAKHVASLVDLVSSKEPSVQSKLLTAEDSTAHFLATCSYCTADTEELTDTRKTYSIPELSQQIWDRATHVSVMITLPGKDSSMITLGVNKADEPKRLMYYWQAIDREISTELLASTRNPMHGFELGDGFSAPHTSPVPSLSFKTSTGNPEHSTIDSSPNLNLYYF